MNDLVHIRIAVAIARGVRWIAITAIAIGATLLGSLFMGRPLHVLAAVALSLAILLGGAVVSLMVRIELDRSIFEAALGAADVNAYFTGFDQSRSQFPVGKPPREARSVADRVRGLIGLAATMGYLFVAQAVLALAGVWIGRWPF